MKLLGRRGRAISRKDELLLAVDDGSYLSQRLDDLELLHSFPATSDDEWRLECDSALPSQARDSAHRAPPAIQRRKRSGVFRLASRNRTGEILPEQFDGRVDIDRVDALARFQLEDEDEEADAQQLVQPMTPQGYQPGMYAILDF